MALIDELKQLSAQLQPTDEKYAIEAVNLLLQFAQKYHASDLHLLPDDSRTHLSVQFRINGVLEPAGQLTGAVNIISRLKVLAQLLTYRTDVPQEGRIQAKQTTSEVRVSTFPTIHGEKAVVRFSVGSGHYRNLEDLGYPADIEREFEWLLQERSGLILFCGPSGSGKTTSLYACLREIQSTSLTPRSLCTLEDPVEAVLPGVSQSLVKPETDFTYERGLISLMRQDPDVIMVGEIRDRGTADVVFQASLSGHLVLSSFHAGSAASALGRLAEMDIEPYLLRSGLLAVLAQRLLRECCPCRASFACSDTSLHFPPRSVARGCEDCRQTGYVGRLVVAELLTIGHSEVASAILARRDVPAIERLAIQSGMTSIGMRAHQLIAQGRTTHEECLRVLGSSFSNAIERT